MPKPKGKTRFNRFMKGGGRAAHQAMLRAIANRSSSGKPSVGKPLPPKPYVPTLPGVGPVGKPIVNDGPKGLTPRERARRRYLRYSQSNSGLSSGGGKPPRYQTPPTRPTFNK